MGDWELPSNICFLSKAQQYLPDTAQYVWAMVKVMDCPRSIAKVNEAIESGRLRSDQAGTK